MPRAGKTQRVPDPTDDFFERLGAARHVPLLHDAHGSLRIDLVDGPTTHHVYLQIDGGDVVLSHKSTRADAVVRISRAQSNRIVEGKMNTTAALLRGALSVEGDLAIVTSFQRLFPGPPASQRSYLERQKERDT